MPVLIRIALRNLLEHKAKSFIIGIIIAVGVIILVVGNSFIDTAALGIQRSFIGNFTGNVMVSGKTDGAVSLFGVQAVGGQTATPLIPSYDKVLAYVHSQPEVKYATSQVTGLGAINIPGNEESDSMVFNFLFGIEPASYHEMFNNLDIVSGRYLEPNEEGILLSTDRVKEIKKELKVDIKAGDKVVLNGFGTAGFHIREVTVRGIFEFKQKTDALDIISYVDIQTLRALEGMTVGSTKIENLDKADTALLSTTSDNTESDLFGGGDMVQVDKNANVAVPTTDLASILGDTTAREEAQKIDTGAWHYILITLKNPRQAEAFIAKTNAWFGSQGIEAQAGDWKKAADGFATISDTIRVIFIVAILIVAVVAVIIIMNTLMISVIERTGEIGTMRALGAQKGFIWRMFMAETLTISIVFGVIGMVLSGLIVGVLNLIGIHAANSFLQILFAGPVLKETISVSALVTSLVVVIIVGIVAHLYPVSIALKVQPVKAIQTD